MQQEIGDRLVLQGKHGTRIGVVVERDESGGSRVQWDDGGESAVYVVTEATHTTAHDTSDAASTGPAVTWRRGVTAGVGHEASLAQEKLAKADMAAPTPVDEGEHSVDAPAADEPAAAGD